MINKYNLGQIVYRISTNKQTCYKIISGKITQMAILDDGRYMYGFHKDLDDCPYWYYENQIFATKEELIASL